MSASDRNGFTLIELIVTISIAMILLGGSLAGFLSFQERRKVEAAAREVHQLYVTAKANAAARKVKPDYASASQGCRNETNFRLTGHEVTRSGTTFAIVEFCQTEVTGRHEFKAYTLPTGVTVTTAPTLVRFNSLPIGGQMTNLGSTQTVTIGGATTYSFTISPSGAISNVEQTSP